MSCCFSTWCGVYLDKSQVRFIIIEHQTWECRWRPYIRLRTRSILKIQPHETIFPSPPCHWTDPRLPAYTTAFIHTPSPVIPNHLDILHYKAVHSLQKPLTDLNFRNSFSALSQWTLRTSIWFMSRKSLTCMFNLWSSFWQDVQWCGRRGSFDRLLVMEAGDCEFCIRWIWWSFQMKHRGCMARALSVVLLWYTLTWFILVKFNETGHHMHHPPEGFEALAIAFASINPPTDQR